jgi:membrane associated rhomboid family serine protease
MGRVSQALEELLGELPVLLRYPAVGAAALGLIGGVVGLVLGLRAYAPTAWAAVFEVGIPAALIGALLGLVVVAIMWLRERI